MMTLLAGACAHRAAHSTPTPTPGPDISRGKAIYDSQCAACHGAAGSGGPVGPALRGERLRLGFTAVRAIVEDPQPPMPKLFPARLSAGDVRNVTAYVESL
jgi:alcohol dehydrogenase (cytochrome c)